MTTYNIYVRVTEITKIDTVNIFMGYTNLLDIVTSKEMQFFD